MLPRYTKSWFPCRFLPTPTARPEGPMRVLPSICVALFGTFVACSDSTQPQGPVTLGSPEFAEAFTSNETVPFATVVSQPCTGELMQWSGEVHTKDHVTIQPD